METNFKIARYTKENDSFVKDGYDEYKITYLKGAKPHRLRIVVNGYLTKRTINIIDFRSGYKNEILLAIKEFLTEGSLSKNRVNKKVSISYIEQFYSKQIVINIKNYLLPIQKEESRDKLTEFGLIPQELNTFAVRDSLILDVQKEMMDWCAFKITYEQVKDYLEHNKLDYFDTAEREDYAYFLAKAITGMDWPMNFDIDEYKESFYKK